MARHTLDDGLLIGVICVLDSVILVLDTVILVLDTVILVLDTDGLAGGTQSWRDVWESS